MPRTPGDTRALFYRLAKTYDVGLASGKGSASGPLAGYAESPIQGPGPCLSLLRPDLV